MRQSAASMFGHPVGIHEGDLCICIIAIRSIPAHDIVVPGLATALALGHLYPFSHSPLQLPFGALAMSGSLYALVTQTCLRHHTHVSNM